MTPQELKASILQLAIQGKLVEQRAEEGTAEELYQQIQKEKQRLIKAGTIKKEKLLPTITQEETPFDIPESWKWIRWGEIVNVVSARRVHQADWRSVGIPFYRAREIAKLAEEGNVDNELFISEELFNEFSFSGVPQPGDLMVTAVGTLGKTYIVQPNDKFYYKDASVICLENFAHLDPAYLKLVMQSEMMMSQVRSNSGGTTVATLTMVRMVEYVFPLPPLAEQKRIVAKIEELLPYIDRYEQAWSRLENFNRRFPVDMQKSILQMAIQGKLVEHNDLDEDIDIELDRIRKKRETLIASKHLKKLGKINKTSEVILEIPDTWRLVPLHELICKRVDNRGKTPPYSHVRTEEFCIDLLEINSIIPGKSIDHTRIEKYIDKKTYATLRGYVEKDDILIATVGSVGKFAMMDDSQSAIAQNIIAIKCFEEVEQKYIFYLLQTPYFYESMNNITMEAVQASIKVPDLMNLRVPLPPLAEQKRIVAKLEELLPLCERLK